MSSIDVAEFDPQLVCAGGTHQPRLLADKGKGNVFAEQLLALHLREPTSRSNDGPLRPRLAPLPFTLIHHTHGQNWQLYSHFMALALATTSATGKTLLTSTRTEASAKVVGRTHGQPSVANFCYNRLTVDREVNGLTDTYRTPNCGWSVPDPACWAPPLTSASNDAQKAVKQSRRPISERTQACKEEIQSWRLNTAMVAEACPQAGRSGSQGRASLSFHPTRRNETAWQCQYDNRVGQGRGWARRGLSTRYLPYPVVRTFVAGAIQMHVLHHASKHEIHGAWMTAELARHGHTLSPGTLYPALHRMEAAGLLTSRYSSVNSRRVRYYMITETGRAELTTNRNVLQRLADDLLAPPVNPPPPDTH